MKFKVGEIVESVVNIPFGVSSDELQLRKGTRLKIIGIRVGAPYPYIAIREIGLGYSLYISESEIQRPPSKMKKPSKAATCPRTATGVEAEVCADIAARQRLGIAKYGTTVEANPIPLGKWLKHAYQECLDQAIYLKKAMAVMDAESVNQTSVKTHTKI